MIDDVDYNRDFFLVSLCLFWQQFCVLYLNLTNNIYIMILQQHCCEIGAAGDVRCHYGVSDAGWSISLSPRPSVSLGYYDCWNFTYLRSLTPRR